MDTTAPMLLAPSCGRILKLVSLFSSCWMPVFCFPEGGTTSQVCGFSLANTAWSAFWVSSLPTRLCSHCSLEPPREQATEWGLVWVWGKFILLLPFGNLICYSPNLFPLFSHEAPSLKASSGCCERVMSLFGRGPCCWGSQVFTHWLSLPSPLRRNHQLSSLALNCATFEEGWCWQRWDIPLTHFNADKLFFPSLIECWNSSGNLDFHEGSLTSFPKVLPDCNQECPELVHILLYLSLWYLVIYYPKHWLPGLLHPTTPTKVFLLMDGCQVFVVEVRETKIRAVLCYHYANLTPPGHPIFYIWWSYPQ